MSRVILFCVLALGSGLARGQDSSRVLTGEFRPGAAAVGLGGSLVVQARDASAIYWNPALLTGLLDRQLLISVNEPFKFDYVGFSQFIPLYGTVGIAWARDPSQGAIVDRGTLAWARKFSRTLSFGVNLNVQKHLQDWFADASVGVFVGNSRIGTVDQPWRAYRKLRFLDRLNLGLVLRHLPIGDRLFSTSAEAGLSYLFPGLGLLFNSGYHIRNGENTTHLGFSAPLSQGLTLMVGVQEMDLDQLGLGVGYTHDNFIFNLTYSTAVTSLLFSLTARISPPPDQLARPYYERASESFRAKEYGRAAKQYRQFLAFDLRQDARSDTAYFRVRALERKLARDRALVDSLLAVSGKLLAKGESQYLRAALVLTKVVEIDPGNLKARSKLSQLKPYIDKFVKRALADGVYEFERERFFRAQKAFNRVLLFDKKNEIAHTYLSQIDEELKKLGEDYFYRGITYFRNQNYAGAREEFMRALKYSPQHEEAASYLKRTMQMLAENEKRVTQLIKQGQALEKQNRYREATNRYLEVLRLDENNEFVKRRIAVLRPKIKQFVQRKYQQGLRYLQAEEYAKAQEALSEVLSLDPKHPGARSSLARLRQEKTEKVNAYLAQADAAFQNGDWVNALDLYSRAGKMAPGNARALEGKREAEKQLQIDALLQQARNQFNEQDYIKAIEVYSRILDLDPNNEVARVEREAAKSKVEELVEKYFNEGITYYTLDQYNEAVNALDKALSLNPSHKGALEYKRKAQDRIRALQKLK